MVIFCVPGTYLHVSIPKDKRILMKFGDRFVGIMCEVNPEYREYLLEERGEMVLYTNIL